MAVNNLTYEQSYAFLTDLYEQATGQKSTISVTDTGTFTTVAQMVLKTGYDNIISSISQVLGRTIFSVRPYSARFKGIRVDAQRWGAITRKINYIDTPLETDKRMTLTDGASVDQWTVQKPKVVETNFYGSQEYAKHITIFRDQLDAAFASADAFGSFVGGLMQNISDQLEQIHEEQARGCLINMMTGVYKTAGDNSINVLQAYYDETGVQLTPETMYNQTNYIDFTKWLYSFVNTLTDMLGERTIKYHTNITGKPVMRHTPIQNMKAYMLSSTQNKIDSSVLSTVFGPDKLKMIDFEKVAFWQNIEDPDAVKATPTYLAADGSLTTETNAVDVPHVLGCIFDEEALGITTENNFVQSTGINAAGNYSNMWYSFRERTWNDFTENFVLLYAADVNA